MKKIENLEFILTNNIKHKYFYYEINKQNFGIYKICFSISTGIYIKPIRYMDYRLNDNTKNIVNYHNIDGKDVMNFLDSVEGYSYSLTRKEFYIKWNYWLNAFTKAGKFLKNK